MYAPWGCRGNPRRAVSQVENVCLECRIWLRQRALYHPSPQGLKNYEPKRYNTKDHKHDPKGGKDARPVRKMISKSYIPAAMSLEGVRTPTTRLVGYHHTEGRGTKRGHDSALVYDNMWLWNINRAKDHIPSGVSKRGLKRVDAGSKESSTATKAEGNQKLRIKKIFARTKVRLINVRLRPKAPSAIGKPTGTQEVNIEEPSVNRDDTAVTKRFTKYDSQNRKTTLVGSAAIEMSGIERQREAKTLAAISRSSLRANMEGAHLGQRNSLLPSGLRHESVLSKHRGILQFQSTFHKSARCTRVTLNFMKQQHASTTTYPISRPGQIPVSMKEWLSHSKPRNSKTRSVRDELQTWQEKQDVAVATKPVSIENNQREPGSLQNLITRSHGADRVDEPMVTEGDARERREIFIDDGELIENIDDDVFLKPGDLVELRVDGKIVLAIHVRTLILEAQFYTAEGKWCDRPLREMTWADRHFVDVSEVAPILPYLPSTEIPIEELNELHTGATQVPRDVGAKLIEKMNKYQRASNEIYRAHAHRIDHVFEIMAKDKHLSYATLSDIASRVLQISDVSKISRPGLYAVHRACMQVDVGFQVETHSHWANGEYEIMSKREITVIRQAREWLREYQEDLIQQTNVLNKQATHDPALALVSPKTGDGALLIAGFVKKARHIVTNSRLFRSMTDSGSIGPNRIRLKPQKSPYSGAPDGSAVKHVILGSFTEQENVLLRFLEIWIVRRCLYVNSPVNAMGPMLLRAIGLYEGFDLDQRTGFTFLKEMGVFAPWENRVVYDTRLALPGYHFDTLTDELQANATESLEDWAPKDSMQDLRKDWGNLEVFCIDDATAQEIDDGFSLERIEGDTSQFWIHVHVANPTAFFSPEHPVSKYAAQIIETLYLPEKIYPMLPQKLTRKYFSLGRNRPALTFSAKIDMNGEILETNITPSVVRNVKYFTAETIAQELSSEDTKFALTHRLVVGSNPVPSNTSQQNPGKHMSNALDDSQRQTLKTLNALGAARNRRRHANGAVNISFQNLDASVYFVEPTQPYRRVIRRIEGDPTILVSAGDFNPIQDAKMQDLYSGDRLVKDIMLLACETAALWTSSRGIPTIYRGTRENLDIPSPLEYKRLILDPLVGPHGIPPFLKMVEYMSLVGRGYSSVDPVHHQMMGTDAYIKVTSPLRRYGDMIAHWQIEAALRYEAATGKSVVSTTDDSYLPFSRDRVTTLLPHISKREKYISRTKRNAQRHWVLQALFRAFYFQEAMLPETFEVYVWADDNRGLDRMQAVTKQLRLDVLVQEDHTSRAKGGTQRGDWWEAKIERVDIYGQEIIMKPLRLIERAEPEMLIDSIARLFTAKKGTESSP
ncbi:hypothetical protein MMC11_004584 [Xylographa trunciseda]|nr:hypothetical protein [Xylographa trunciseda]